MIRCAPSYQIQDGKKMSVNKKVRWYLKSAKATTQEGRWGAFSRYLLYQVLCVNTKEIKTVRGSRSAGVNG